MSENSRFPAAQYLDYMLAAASEHVRRQLAGELERRGVPIEYWRVLTLLAPGQGWTMGDLAEGALMSLPTATRTIDKMVSDALVYRAPDGNDRRKVVIFVSDKGLKLWRDVKRSADRYQDSIVGEYGDEWMAELLAKLDNLAGGKLSGPQRPRKS